jgi:hypothetical protein
VSAEERPAPRDAGNWAGPVSALHVGEVPAGTPNLVEGKRLVGPVQGFGRMWQKTYRARLEGADATPAEVIREWKDHFPELWPKGNHFHAPLAGLEPGEVALIRASGPAGLRLSTGVMVLYADEDSFTLMTPEGHMFAGWITFSACEDAGATVAQAVVLMRAQDPLSELGLSLGGHRLEDRCWQQTLTALGARFGVTPTVETRVSCVDARRQWSRARNIRTSVAVRSGLYAAAAPLRAVRPRRTAG